MPHAVNINKNSRSYWPDRHDIYQTKCKQSDAQIAMHR